MSLTTFNDGAPPPQDSRPAEVPIMAQLISTESRADISRDAFKPPDTAELLGAKSAFEPKGAEAKVAPPAVNPDTAKIMGAAGAVGIDSKDPLLASDTSWSMAAKKAGQVAADKLIFGDKKAA